MGEWSGAFDLDSTEQMRYRCEFFGSMHGTNVLLLQLAPRCWQIVHSPTLGCKTLWLMQLIAPEINVLR
jgi:hypothetical protein